MPYHDTEDRYFAPNIRRFPPPSIAEHYVGRERRDVSNIAGLHVNQIKTSEVKVLGAHTLLPFSRDCTLRDLSEFAKFSGASGVPYVAAIQLTSPKVWNTTDDWTFCVQEQLYPWLKNLSFDEPTTLLLKAIIQAIGMDPDCTAGFGELVADIYGWIHGVIRTRMKAEFYRGSSNSLDAKDRDTFYVAQLAVEAETMKRLLQGWSSCEGAREGDIATAQAIFCCLKMAYGLDFVLITPTSTMATVETVGPDTCVILFVPETREWISCQRGGPRAAHLTRHLARNREVEEPLAPYFDRFMIYYRGNFQHDLDPNCFYPMWKIKVPWDEIDEYYRSDERPDGASVYNARIPFEPHKCQYWLSPYVRDIIDVYTLGNRIRYHMDRDYSWIDRRVTHCLYFRQCIGKPLVEWVCFLGRGMFLYIYIFKGGVNILVTDCHLNIEYGNRIELVVI
jgi:hypothetical protein